jgi:hypothetical protein
MALQRALKVAESNCTELISNDILDELIWVFLHSWNKLDSVLFIGSIRFGVANLGLGRKRTPLSSPLPGITHILIVLNKKKHFAVAIYEVAKHMFSLLDSMVTWDFWNMRKWFHNRATQLLAFLGYPSTGFRCASKDERLPRQSKFISCI